MKPSDTKHKRGALITAGLARVMIHRVMKASK